MLEIANHGPIITATNYWASEYAANGKMIVSPNAGVIRCLVPPRLYPTLGELRAAEYAIVSVDREGIEILWEDHTQDPHAWHLLANRCLLVPGDPSPSHWAIACWVERRGQPHKALERPCHWRRVAKLPCMERWAEM